MRTASSTKSDELVVLARIAAGDEEALHRLYLAYRPRLRRYLWHLLDGDLHTVDEALQDVFVAAWRTAGTYRGDARVSTWLYQIAHNVAFHTRRLAARVAATEHFDSPHEDDRDERRYSASSEDEVIDRLSLGHALERISPKHREVLALVFQHGFSLDETARILDVPVGTVKSRISYARKALLRELSATPPEEMSRDR